MDRKVVGEPECSPDEDDRPVSDVRRPLVGGEPAGAEPKGLLDWPAAVVRWNEKKRAVELFDVPVIWLAISVAVAGFKVPDVRK